jgi:hypothetical protein
MAKSKSPVPVLDIDLASYREALRWLLNFTAAEIPPPSSIAQSFWVSGRQMQSPSTTGIILQNFQSVLAFPFWFFNSNNWANPQLTQDVIVSTLPPQFYTEASIVAPYTKIQVSRPVFVVFCIFQGLVMVFIWVVLLWVAFGAGRVPKTSSYPLYDIIFNTNIEGKPTRRETNMKNSLLLKGITDTRILVK